MLMGLREKIENNLGLVIGGFVIASFAAGFGAYGAIQSVASTASTASEQSHSASWQDDARKDGWLPRVECPAYPISLTISSPGDQAVVGWSSWGSEARFLAALVIKSTYPIAETMQVGVVFNEEGTGNYYVEFSALLQSNDDRKIFRESEGFSVPFVPSGQKTINMWALAVDEPRSIGNVFSSLRQIQDSNPTVVLSPQIAIQPRIKE